MRMIRFRDSAGQTQQAYDLGDGRMERLSGPNVSAEGVFPGALTGQMGPVPERLLSPLDPVAIYCIGLNFAEHAKEGGRDVPKRPVIFMKPNTAVNHPGGPIRIPACQMAGPEVDYECELAVIIGRSARDVPAEKALDFVFGYTCANDVSARRWQKQGGGGQFVRGKGFDTFCPLGPCIVTADEIPDPQDLRIRTILNGQVMQDATTRDMIFPVKALISFLSQDTTLRPGTVILTGTPSGVGFARTPPVWLEHGDEVTIEIEKIGRLTNPVVE